MLFECDDADLKTYGMYPFYQVRNLRPETWVIDQLCSHAPDICGSWEHHAPYKRLHGLSLK